MWDKWKLGRSIRSMTACVAIALGTVALMTAVPAAGQVAGPPYPDSTFKFATTVKDDKKDEGGGWQEARAKLLFTRSGEACTPTFTCNVTVGMPLRTRSRGTIAPDWAAKVTALATTLAVSKVGTPGPTTQQAVYCREVKDEMDKLFKNEENRDLGVVINAL